jgi:dihydroorotase
MSTTLLIPAPADFHVHLRQGTLSELVTPHVRKGGFRLAYVMVSNSDPSRVQLTNGRKSRISNLQ